MTDFVTLSAPQASALNAFLGRHRNSDERLGELYELFHEAYDCTGLPAADLAYARRWYKAVSDRLAKSQ